MDLPPGALCRLDHIPDGTAAAVDAVLPDGPENLIVLRDGEEARAWINVCPHAGRRLDWAPGQFLISRGTLICAVHGASFRTGDGLCVVAPAAGNRCARCRCGWIAGWCGWRAIERPFLPGERAGVRAGVRRNAFPKNEALVAVLALALRDLARCGGLPNASRRSVTIGSSSTPS